MRVCIDLSEQDTQIIENLRKVVAQKLRVRLTKEDVIESILHISIVNMEKEITDDPPNEEPG